jgi:hypothetical protein
LRGAGTPLDDFIAASERWVITADTPARSRAGAALNRTGVRL